MEIGGKMNSKYWIFLIVAVSVIMSSFSIYKSVKSDLRAKRNEAQLDSLKAKIFDLQFNFFKQDFEKEVVDLLSSDAQSIESGFLVSDLKLTQRKNVIIVSGRIINSSSVGYRNAVFKINVYGKENQIQINELKPGGSQFFNVEVTDVPVDELKFAIITHEDGQIVFY